MHLMYHVCAERRGVPEEFDKWVIRSIALLPILLIPTHEQKLAVVLSANRPETVRTYATI